MAVGGTAAPAKRYHAKNPGCHTRKCDRRVGRAWAIKQARKLEREIQALGSTTASWYNDAGGTACGTHYAQGVASHYEGQPASAGLPCGTHLRICNGSACEVAVVEDRGPYVAGRELDLNPGAKAAIGCSDLCHVTYGIVH